MIPQQVMFSYLTLETPGGVVCPFFRREFSSTKSFTVCPLIPEAKDKRQLLVHIWPESGK